MNFGLTVWIRDGVVLVAVVESLNGEEAERVWRFGS